MTEAREAVAAPTPAAQPSVGWIGRWTRILSAYFGAQTAVQAATVVAGLLFVNFMSIEQFALYTLALSIVTFFHFVTDLGSTSSLVYFKRRAAEEEEPFAPYVAAVRSLRGRAFALGAAFAVAAFAASARTDGFGPTEIALAAAALVASVGFQIVASIRLLVLRLEDRYGASYRAELAGALLRAALAAGLVLATRLPAWAAVASGAAAAALTSRMARSAPGEGSNAADLGSHRRRVLRYLLPTLPSALYFSIQGPLVVWLATTFGEVRNVAEVGALGRLGMIMSLFSGLVGVVFLPRLAHVRDERLYLRRYLQYGGFLALIALAILAVAWLVPDLLLALIGPNYRGLHQELLLVVEGAGLTLLGGYAVGVSMARSWTRWQPAATAVLALCQIGLGMALPLDATIGLLTFQVGTAGVGLALQLAIHAGGFLAPHRVAWS